MNGKQKGTIRQTFSDISLLYKNFLHWNISKLLYFIYGIALGILSIIPFGIIYFIYTRFAGGTFLNYINSLLYSLLLGDWFSNLLLLLSMFIFGIFFCYSYFLLLKLNNSYLDKKPISYLSNSFFDYKLVLKYFLLTLLFILLVFVLPILGFVIIFSIGVYLVGGLEAALMLSLSAAPNGFIIFTFLSFVILILLFFYLFYRFIFSYFILSEQKGQYKPVVAIKESFKITNSFKKLFQFIKIFFVLMVIYLPFYMVNTSIESSYEDINNYARYMSFPEDKREEVKLTFERLELSYSHLSAEELSIMQNRYYITSLIFSVLKFLFISGVFLMALNSIYRRLLTK